jgi:pimeloyl-ACP methyl ester carboxylesterase
MKVERFTIAIPDAALADLKSRLAHTRWPDEISHIGWQQGAALDYMQQLVAYWRDAYDWRAEEAALNRFAHFRAGINGHTVHFIHERAKNGRGFPLIFTHGWPGGFIEAVKLIPLLTDPESHGGHAEDAFDVVVPSLPGYGFSPAPTAAGMNSYAIAELWAELMFGLGYERFAAQGGDWGASICTWLALQVPSRVAGIHLNYIPGSYDPPRAADGSDLAPEERAFLASRDQWLDADGAYGHIQGTKPQTAAYALNDSPAGLCAWIAEKFRDWSDWQTSPHSVPEDAISRDTLLTNISIYWFTQTIASSMRLYWEGRRRPVRFAPGQRVEVPVGVARFAKEEPMPPRKWVERCYNVQRWTELPRGGHFAALEQPEILAQDIREFSRALR